MHRRALGRFPDVIDTLLRAALPADLHALVRRLVVATREFVVAHVQKRRGELSEGEGSLIAREAGLVARDVLRAASQPPRQAAIKHLHISLPLDAPRVVAVTVFADDTARLVLDHQFGPCSRRVRALARPHRDFRSWSESARCVPSVCTAQRPSARGSIGTCALRGMETLLEY